MTFIHGGETRRAIIHKIEACNFTGISDYWMVRPAVDYPDEKPLGSSPDKMTTDPTDPYSW